jgi:hypothetical protein
VSRYRADQVALDEITAHYETSGQLSVPLITEHTTGDPVIPYWHAIRYRSKVILADNIALHEHVEVERYGHCNFTGAEIVDSVFRLQQIVRDPPPYQAVNRLYTPLVLSVE